MNAATHPERSWPGLKLAVAAAILFGLQAMLVFWLGKERSSPPLQQPSPVRIETGGDMGENFPTASSPTLLAVPSIEGASGPAWLKKEPPTNRTPEWTGEPDAALARPPIALADDLTNLAGAGSPPLRSVAGIPNAAPPILNVFSTSPAESSITIEGDLARRKLLAQPDLTSLPADSVLSNTVIQIEITGDGWPAVPAAVASGGKSGTGAAADAADDYALGIANGLRFEPLPRRSPSGARLPDPGLTSGRIVFHWQTVAPATTNAPQNGP